MFCFLPRVAAVLFLVIAGIVASAAAGERPISAMGAGNNNNGSMSASSFEATHLGKAIFFGYVDSDLFFNSQIIEFQGLLRASNSDVLVVDVNLDFDVDTGIAIGTLTFSGGTGRFQNATGSADVMFDFGTDFNHTHFSFLIDGSIDY